jgi:hypothetical protein
VRAPSTISAFQSIIIRSRGSSSSSNKHSGSVYLGSSLSLHHRVCDMVNNIVAMTHSRLTPCVLRPIMPRLVLCE